MKGKEGNLPVFFVPLIRKTTENPEKNTGFLKREESVFYGISGYSEKSSKITKAKGARTSRAKKNNIKSGIGKAS
ncbi:MAG: hypothetical protein UC662_12790 [Paraprevotella clara]|nr:hypothetical protein [Paraprevotella clara]